MVLTNMKRFDRTHSLLSCPRMCILWELSQPEDFWNIDMEARVVANGQHQLLDMIWN